MEDPKYRFFNDLDDNEAKPWLLKVTHQCRAAFESDAPYVPWGEVPATYLVCEQDHCFSVEMQIHMAQSTGDMSIERCNAGHFPFISIPNEVADLIVRIAKQV
jgi:pimeloyl-ACP methyl ester carboxylesterase